MTSFRKRQDRSSVWPKATGLTGVKVNVNYVSGSKAYAFKHHKDFMFCSGFFLCIFMKILQHPEVLRFSFLLESITGLLGKHLYA